MSSEPGEILEPPDGKVVRRMDLRWRDIDGFGHLTHSVYHDFLAEIRAVALEGLLGLDTVNFVLAHVELDYRAEVRHSHRYVEVTGSIPRLSRRSVEIAHSIQLPDGAVAAEGDSVLVGWDTENRRSLELAEIAKRAQAERDA